MDYNSKKQLNFGTEQSIKKSLNKVSDNNEKLGCFNTSRANVVQIVKMQKVNY
jgi:hypothetical protein